MDDIKTKWHKRRYQIIEPRKGVFRLVRVLGDYDNYEEAVNDLYDVCNNIKTEEEIVEKRLESRF